MATVLLLGLYLIYQFYQNKYPVFRMFYVDWCPHCQKAKPEFMKLMTNGTFIEINGKRVELEMIDGDDPNNKDLMEKFHVDRYPTFIYSTCEGKNTPFEGDPKESLFRQFLADKLI